MFFDIPKFWMSGFDNTDIVKRDGDFFLNSSFLDFFLQYNITNDNRLIIVDIFIEKE